MSSSERSLEVQRREFSEGRLLAMPLAGTLAWIVIAIAGATLPMHQAAWVIYIATGSIAYLGMGISKLTGEDFLDKSKPKNTFDGLFFHAVGASLLGWGIAIPLALADPTALPLGVGILAGTMWLPMGWIIRHWIGAFHAIARTALLLVLHYAFPEDRYVAVPLGVVAMYLVSIPVLELRWRRSRMAVLLPKT
jgi:hypothetical protein